MAKRRRVLEIRITGAISEVPARFSWPRVERSSLYDIEAALRRASDDRKIDGVLLELADVRIGWSKAESLHRAIRDVRASGKATVAFLAGADNVTYMLASACESVVLAPAALLSLQSLSSDRLVFQGSPWRDRRKSRARCRGGVQVGGRNARATGIIGCAPPRDDVDSRGFERSVRGARCRRSHDAGRRCRRRDHIRAVPA